MPRLKRSHAKGQSLVEYALILSLVSIVCASTLSPLGQTVSFKLGQVKQALEVSGSNGVDGPPIVEND